MRRGVNFIASNDSPARSSWSAGVEPSAVGDRSTANATASPPTATGAYLSSSVSPVDSAREVSASGAASVPFAAWSASDSALLLIV